MAPVLQPALERAFMARITLAEGVLASWKSFTEGLSPVLVRRLQSGPAAADRARGQEQKLRELRQRLDEALKDLRHELRHPSVNLATTGTTSSGKSALVNLLCGSEIMPVAVGEMSAGVVTIYHSHERKVVVHPTPGAKWECGSWDGQSDDQIRERLTRIMDAYNELRGQESEPACPLVDLHYPTRVGMRREMLGLPEGFKYCLLDLPGLKYIGDQGNSNVIRTRARGSMCLVLYNSAEVNPHLQKKLLEEVAQQVKELGGSPARMLFILNRIDVFAQNLNGKREEEEFVHRTASSIKNVLKERLLEYETEIDALTPIKLSTLPALLAQRVTEQTGTTRVETLKRLDRYFRGLIPEDVLGDLPNNVAKWREDDVRSVANAVLDTSYANNFYRSLRQHIQDHLPDLVLPPVVDRFRANGGRDAVEWALFTARSELNGSRERYAEECRIIAQTTQQLKDLRDQAAKALRKPFEEIRRQLDKMSLTDEASVKRAVSAIRQALQKLEKTPPYDRMPRNSLAPLYTWRDDLALAVERVINESVGTALLKGQKLEGDAIEQLPAGTRRSLTQAVTALQSAGYDPHTAQHGQTLRAEDETGRQRLRAINSALSNLAERLGTAMEDVVFRASKREIGRIFEAMEKLFDQHKNDVAQQARKIAPGFGLEMPEAQLEMIRRDLSTAYGYSGGIDISQGQEQVQTGTKRERTGTRYETRVVGQRSWWNPVGWFCGRDITETVEVPVFAERPVYSLRSYEEAVLPPFKTLSQRWIEQTRQRDPELITQFIDWLLTQADQVSGSIERFQEELLSRYQKELDAAHAAAKAVAEEEQAVWSGVLKLAEELESSFGRFSNLRAEG